MVPLGHPTSEDPSKNVGEVVGLSLSQDGEKLMATIDVRDETIAEKIKKNLIKGISASIAENYVKKETGESVGPTLFHAALVTEPYIKGMAGFVPLSEEFEGSLVIPILNMEVPLTLEEMGDRLSKIEEKISLSEKTESSEQESSEKETSEEESTESSKVGEKAEEEKEGESKTEESKTEETETEAEEAKGEVDLAEAEKTFNELLNLGKVIPAEKELLLPLLASDTLIELGEGKKITSRKSLVEYLKRQPSRFSLAENGTSEPPTETKEKEEEVPEDINTALEGMQLGDTPEEKKKIYKEFQKEKEKEKESTPF